MKLLLLLSLLFFCGCLTPEKGLNIAIVRGEPLNVRPNVNKLSPGERFAGELALEKNRRPVVYHVNRQRAFDMFEEGRVDLVVSGQASEFDEKFSASMKVKEKTKAVYLQLKNSKIAVSSANDLLKSGTSAGIMRDSAFAKHFVKKAGGLSLIMTHDFSEALRLLKAEKISGIIIDAAAVQHAKDFLEGFKITELGLEEELIKYLIR